MVGTAGISPLDYEHACLSEAVGGCEEAIHVILGRVKAYVKIAIPGGNFISIRDQEIEDSRDKMVIAWT